MNQDRNIRTASGGKEETGGPTRWLMNKYTVYKYIQWRREIAETDAKIDDRHFFLISMQRNFLHVYASVNKIRRKRHTWNRQSPGWIKIGVVRAKRRCPFNFIDIQNTICHSIQMEIALKSLCGRRFHRVLCVCFDSFCSIIFADMDV